jgi:hypothetical protein
VHHLLIALATAPAPSPTPSLRPGLSEDQVTPGTWGFIMTAFFVLATTLLIVDMVRRIRRVRYRAQVEEERMAAMAAAEQDMLEVPGTRDAATQASGTQSAATQASGTQPAATQTSGTQSAATQGGDSRTEPDGDEGRGRS